MPGPVARATAAVVGLRRQLRQRANAAAMIERHLQRVNPKLRGTALRGAVQQAFDSYARYYVESFRLPSLQQAHGRPRLHDRRARSTSLDALAGGQRLIFALPHLGGWEWAGRWMTDQGYRITVVVEALEPPELFEWFADLRKELGMTVVPPGPDGRRGGDEGAAATTRSCACCATATSSGTVSRSSSSASAPRCPPARRRWAAHGRADPAAAVLLHGAYNGHLGVVRPPLPLDAGGGLRDDVARITQTLAHELEFLIRRAPEQWHLFQPNWPSDPGYSR